MKKLLLTFTSALLLTACGGDDAATTDTDNWNAGSQSLVYSYPDRNQTEIATATPPMLPSPTVADNAADSA